MSAWIANRHSTVIFKCLDFTKKPAIAGFSDGGAPGEIVRHIPVAHPCGRQSRPPGPCATRTSKIAPAILSNGGYAPESCIWPTQATIKKAPCRGSFNGGAPGEIRTPDRLVRSQVLYPTELQALDSEGAILRSFKRGFASPRHQIVGSGNRKIRPQIDRLIHQPTYSRRTWPPTLQSTS